jgi:methyl-accepting chemotaxis protein
MKDLSIRYKIGGLIAAAVGIFIAMASYFYFGLLSDTEGKLQQLETLDRMTSLSQEARAHLMEARVYEGQFLMTRSLESAGQARRQVQAGLRNLEELNTLTRQPSTQQVVTDMQISLQSYGEIFENVVALWQEKGLTEEDGARGALRSAVHNVETELNAKSLDNLTVTMLMVRRHEKDYLLRGSEKYITRTQNRVEEIKGKISETAAFEEADKQKLNGLWDEYIAKFNLLVQVDQQIAQTMQQIPDLVQRIERQSSQIHQLNVQESEAIVRGVVESEEQAKILVIIVSLICCAALIIFGVFVIRYITRPIEMASAAMEQLKLGRLVQIK